MPEFMDVHRGMQGVTPQALADAHKADVAIQQEEGVTFKHAWADPDSGMSSACPRLRRRTPYSACTPARGTRTTRSTRSPCRSDSPVETSVPGAVALDERGHRKAGAGA